MNEPFWRIFELAKQADLIQWDSLPSGARTPDHESVVKARKFAELIVKECARIAFDESAHAGRMNKPGNCLFGTNIGRRIETHFGVEE